MNKCITCSQDTKVKYCNQECYRKRPIVYTTNQYKAIDNEVVFNTTTKSFKISLSDLDKVKDRLWHYTKSNGIISNLRRDEREAGKHGHIKLHRYITDAHSGKVVDHINGDQTDNTRSNLRVVEQWENMINMKSSDMRNIERRSNSKTFSVRMKRQGKKYYIGNYATIEEAKEARDRAALEIHGELRSR